MCLVTSWPVKPRAQDLLYTFLSLSIYQQRKTMAFMMKCLLADNLKWDKDKILTVKSMVGHALGMPVVSWEEAPSLPLQVS